MKIPKVPRLPRKSSLRCRKCHACHAEDSRRPWVHRRRHASADIYEGTESTTPTTQIEPEDIYGGTESTTPATQSEPEVLKASRLPRKMQRRQLLMLSRRHASADIYGGTQSAVLGAFTSAVFPTLCCVVLFWYSFGVLFVPSFCCCCCCWLLVVGCWLFVVVEEEEEGGGGGGGPGRCRNKNKNHQKPHNTMWGKTSKVELAIFGGKMGLYFCVFLAVVRYAGAGDAEIAWEEATEGERGLSVR